MTARASSEPERQSAAREFVREHVMVFGEGPKERVVMDLAQLLESRERPLLEQVAALRRSVESLLPLARSGRTCCHDFGYAECATCNADAVLRDTADAIRAPLADGGSVMHSLPIWVETPQTFRVDDAGMAVIVRPADEDGKTLLAILDKQGRLLSVGLNFAQATRIADGLTSLKHRRRR